MPSKKRTNTKFKTIFTWLLILSIIALMIVSFSATQHMNEIVVYP